jgi:predicted dehydrogenase
MTRRDNVVTMGMVGRRAVLMAGMAGMAAMRTRASVVALPRKLKLGIIGFDGHVDEVLRVLPQLPDVQLVAVADARSDAGAIASSAKNAYVARAHRYPQASEMLEREKLDVVAVCNNDGDRAGAILACAARKLNVIAEKPLGLTRAELDGVYKAVKDNSIALGMLLPMRFDPPYLAMKQIVSSGAIGEVLQMDAQKSYQLGKRPEWQKSAGSYGSTILWIGIHMIDLMTWTSGRRFTEAASFQSRVGFPELRDMETVTASIFRLDNGGTATLRMDYLRPETAPGHGDDRLRLAGTKGVVEYQEGTGVTLMTADGSPRNIRDLPEKQSVFLDFLQATYTNKKPALPWQETVRANEYTLAAHEAARQHRILKVPVL